MIFVPKLTNHEKLILLSFVENELFLPEYVCRPHMSSKSMRIALKGLVHHKLIVLSRPLYLTRLGKLVYKELNET